MSIRVYMAGDQAEQELRSLLTWLRDEADVRRYARMSLESAQPAVGEMGGALEAIKLVTDEGFQIANFALALLSWRATRSKRPEVTIKRDGVEISLAEADPEAIEKIVAALSPDVL